VLVGMDTLAANFASQGFTVILGVVDANACEVAAELLEQTPPRGAGSRRLLQHTWCQNLAREIRQHPAVSVLLPQDAVAVQCTVFDKSPSKNWLVALHQDRSIPVRHRVNVEGLTGWSEKEGDLFVQLPVSVLEQVTAVRVHLDPCPVESGALRVVPGSHQSGVIDAEQADQLRDRMGELVVPSPRGGALVLKPLLHHASSKASASMQRRVLHFVFGPRVLPFGLEWQHAI
jgi:ectoine hydroxylase-related dioxygenase (phytanoyl-CoA dioxygenase family)